MIRSCPYCGEIWIKVEGCNNLTTCGNRGFSEQAIYDTTEGNTIRP